MGSSAGKRGARWCYVEKRGSSVRKRAVTRFCGEERDEDGAVGLKVAGCGENDVHGGEKEADGGDCG